ncbi:Nucleic-acid-binding protein from transposon X-element, partial [Stegodyphus mimosarum]
MPNEHRAVLVDQSYAVLHCLGLSENEPDDKELFNALRTVDEIQQQLKAGKSSKPALRRAEKVFYALVDAYDMERSQFYDPNHAKQFGKGDKFTIELVRRQNIRRKRKSETQTSNASPSRKDENEWTQPQKTAKLPTARISESSTTPVKADPPTSVPDVSVKNSFDVLSTEEIMDTSSEILKKDDPPANTCVSMPDIKKERVPPIICPRPDVSWSEIRSLFTKLGVQRFTGILTRQKITILFDSAEHRDRALAILMKHDIQFSTFRAKKDTPLKVVVRGLTEDSSPDEIKSELCKEGFPRTDIGRSIYHKKKLLDLKVSFRKFKSNRNTMMCYRCQRYGHGQLFCNNQPRCLKCGKGHLTYTCNLKKEEKPTCVNCKLDHVASAKTCEFRPTIRKKMPLKKSTRSTVFNLSDKPPSKEPITTDKFPTGRKSYSDAASCRANDFNPDENLMKIIRKFMAFVEKCKKLQSPQEKVLLALGIVEEMIKMDF